MEVWVGLAGGIGGVMVGGFMMLVAGQFQSKSADRRLILQFEREEQQRQRHEVLDVKLGSIARIQELIQMTTEALPELIKVADELMKVPDGSATVVDEHIAGPLLSSIQRAIVAMTAMGSPTHEFDIVRGAISAFFDSEDRSTTDSRISGLTVALASLERRHNELKGNAIRGI